MPLLFVKKILGVYLKRINIYIYIYIWLITNDLMFFHLCIKKMTAKTICEILESQVLQFIIVLVLQFSNPDF